MATELGKAYVQIIPSAIGIQKSISDSLKGSSVSAGKAAGLNIAGAIKGAIAAAGIGTALKATLDAGGNLQQSFGGLETLYGNAADAAKKYAAEAAQAGISANTYAEQAVSFGASLKSAFSGDTIKAAEAANTAILDMADNAAKMGTPIESIQNAYQGFAKQNYTMLDNLKLGYGGTKTEMERLLADATKLSGVEYDMNNLGDVYEAIHVIQQDLKLTGVAADEASTTFTGSFGAMKAATENLLANLALGENIAPSLNVLGQSIQAFAFNNLFPMIRNILSSLPELLSGVSGFIVEALNQISTKAPEIAQQGITIANSLINGIISAAPALLGAAANLAIELGKGLLNVDWISIANSILNSLDQAISTAASVVLSTDTSVIDNFLESITAGLPQLLSKGVEIISNICSGILSSLPSLLTAVGNLLNSAITFIAQNKNQFFLSGIDLIFNIARGVISNLPEIIRSVQMMIQSFVSTILRNLPTILSQGIMIVGKLVAGLIQSIPTIIAAIPRLISAIVDGFRDYDWMSIGRNIVRGIAEGLRNAAGMIVDAAKDAAREAFEAAKSALGISSPATTGVYIGEMYDEGIALGIIRNKSLINDAVSEMSTGTFDSLQTSANFDFKNESNNDGRLDVLINLLNVYLPQIAEKEGVDINQLFNGINRQLGWGLQ